MALFSLITRSVNFLPPWIQAASKESVGDRPPVVLLMGHGDEPRQLVCQLVALDNGTFVNIIHVPGDF